MYFGKVAYTFAIISFLSLPSLAQMIIASSQSGGLSSFDLLNAPKLTLAIKGSCKNSDYTYQCKDGFSVSSTLLSKWHKPSQSEDYYVYEDKSNFITFDERGKLIDDFIKASCPSGTLALFSMRDIRHCPDEEKKKMITFSVKWPDWETSKQKEVHLLVCDKDGGTNWLKQIYPKADWQEVRNLPHYYEYIAPTVAKAEEIEKLFIPLRREETLPTGCRYHDCELNKSAFDVCK